MNKCPKCGGLLEWRCVRNEEYWLCTWCGCEYKPDQKEVRTSDD